MSRTKAVVETIDIPLDQIKPSPYQPRLSFNLEDIRGSIHRDGILVPLTVRKKDGYYELVDGERRTRLAKELGYETVPCTIIDVDDETARRMVWKVNTLRQEYTPKEKAYYFKKLQEEYGMSLRGIARECDTEHNTVKAYLNVFKLPDEHQQMVWDRVIPIGVIQELDEIFDAGVYTPAGKLTPAENPQIFEMLNRASKEKYFGAMEVREAIRPYLVKLRGEQIEKAKEALAEVVPEVKTPETPEELERVAITLRREARKRREDALTPKEKARIEAEKKRKAEEKRKRAEEKKRREEEERRRIEEEARKEAEEELKERLEAERKRIEEQTKEELLRDTEFIREFIVKEYPPIHETLDIEDLRGLLMQRLMANIPEEKKERAEKIFKEEWGSLEKRIKMFPEKSAMMEPKFDRLRQLEEEGVFLTTLWDIGERADYAGKGDFHGNCPPQVVENCVLLKTKKGELVVDPMAGSGTALDVCKLLDRRCIGYDIKPPEQRNDIIKNDSRKIPLGDNITDMVFLHPPYWDMVYYTSANEGLTDLSRAKTLDEYLDMLERVLRECYRILKSGRCLCILLGDRIRDGEFIPLCRKVANLAEKIGFTDCGYAIKFTKGSTSLVVKGKTIYAELAYAENLPKINHDLVMFFKKE